MPLAEISLKPIEPTKKDHGTALIGRTSQRVLKQGHHVLKLRYGAKRGKPTRLKLLASPAAADTCP